MKRHFYGFTDTLQVHYRSYNNPASFLSFHLLENVKRVLSIMYLVISSESSTFSCYFYLFKISISSVSTERYAGCNLVFFDDSELIPVIINFWELERTESEYIYKPTYNS